MTEPIRSGGCFCGDVRYTTSGEPYDVGWCCCRMCQRSVGAASVPWVTLAAEQVALVGRPRWVRSSRRAERGFCGACGTSLFWRSIDGRILDVTLASLDDPASLTPTNSMFTAELPPWASFPADLPHWPGLKPVEIADPVATLDWLADLIEGKGIPWCVSGGLAARAYGSERPLADIDIEVPDEAIAALLPELAPFVTSGPERHRSERWDLLLCTLDHHGQIVDLCGGTSCKIFDHRTLAWRDDPFVPGEVEHREVFGRRVPVIPRERLLAYKRALGREVDVADVRMIEAAAD